MEESRIDSQHAETPGSVPGSGDDANRIMTPEDIARLIAAQTEEETAPETASEVPSESSVPYDDSSPGEEPAEIPPDNAEKKVKASPAALLMGRLKKFFSRIKLPALKGRTPVSDEDAGMAEKKKQPNPISQLLGALKKPKPAKEGARPQTVEAPVKLTAEGADETPDAAGAAKDTPQKRAQRGKSGLKTALGILGVLLLMTGSFAAGYVAKDFLAPPVQDPARQQAEAEALANEARAKELAEISPKDYTASMYLDSILLKGKAEKTTTVKLQKIDDVSKLTAFPNLRRIKIDGMTGNEDLSVLQELSGVEEIIIENSVLRNQFRQGRFDSVTYIEMYDCTIEDPSQFANFKGLTQFYAYSTKFRSKTGTLELTTYLPAAETLTLSNCGEFDELEGVRDLARLKSLSLSSRTLIRNMTYTENPAIERLKVDVSFVEDIQQLQKLADLKNLKHITLQSKTDRLTASQLNSVKRWIKSRFPEATVETATY